MTYRNDLPDKHNSKDDQKHSDAFSRLRLVAVECLHERVDGDVDGPQHLGGLHEDAAEQAGYAVGEQLRRDDQEDGGARVGVHVVVESLGCEDLGGHGRGGAGRGHDDDEGMFLWGRASSAPYCLWMRGGRHHSMWGGWYGKWINSTFGLLTRIKREWVDISKWPRARDPRHTLAQYIADDGQENDRDIDGLGLEVVDFLKHRGEDGEPRPLR